jgi:hypothetical protein
MIKPDTKKVMARRRWETEEPFTYETRPAIVISPKNRHKVMKIYRYSVTPMCNYILFLVHHLL